MSALEDELATGIGEIVVVMARPVRRRPRLRLFRDRTTNRVAYQLAGLPGVCVVVVGVESGRGR